MRIRLSLIAFALALLQSASPSSANRIEESRLVDGVGVWRLGRLGSATIALPGRHRTEAKYVNFRLPSTAYQPRDSSSRHVFYLIRLDAILTLQEDSGSGYIMITGGTNGCTGAQINVHVVGAHGSRKPKMYVNSVDLLEGSQETMSQNGRARIKYANYLPICGIRPGLGRLEFAVERFGHARIGNVRILPTSGLEVVKQSPAHLAFAYHLASSRPVMGKSSELKVTVLNTGDQPARGVTLQLTSLSRKLEVVSPKTIVIGTLDDAETQRFNVRSSTAGQYDLELQALSGNTNKPSATIEVNIGSGGQSDDGIGRSLWIPWLALVVLSISMWSYLRRKRQRREPARQLEPNLTKKVDE